METERDKDNHGRASEIFSGSMASGSYLLLDGAANRLKLPLSLCQDENVQLYFLTEETVASILCGRHFFSTETRWAVEPVRPLLLFYSTAPVFCCILPLRVFLCPCSTACSLAGRTLQKEI